MRIRRDIRRKVLDNIGSTPLVKQPTNQNKKLQISMVSDNQYFHYHNDFMKIIYHLHCIGKETNLLNGIQEGELWDLSDSTACVFSFHSVHLFRMEGLPHHRLCAPSKIRALKMKCLCSFLPSPNFEVLPKREDRVSPTPSVSASHGGRQESLVFREVT